MPKPINKKINKKPLLPEFLYVLVVFIAFFLLSFRKIFGIKGILGHNWDWSFPAIDVLFKKIDLLSRYAWWDFDLGSPLNLTLSQIGPNTVVKSLAFIFPPKVVIIILLFLVTLTAFFSFKKLLDFLNQKNFLNYLPALLFAFSPFLFSDIIGGSWYMWVSYAASPLFFLNLVKFSQEGKVKYLLGFLVTSVFVIASLQHFFLIELITFAYLIFQLFFNKDKELNLKKVILCWISAQTLLIVFNLYWLLPFFFSFGDFVKSSSAASFAGSFESVRYSTQNLLSIASLTGYLDRNLYYFVLNEGLVAFMSLAVFAIWGSIISFFIWGKKEAKIKASAWGIILFLLVLIVKGGNDPLEELTMWIYNHFPLMKLYRSPQHLMFTVAFIIPVLFSFSLDFCCQKFAKYQKLILSGFVLCLFFWLSGWWFNGDMGHTILKNQKKDYVDFYELSPLISEVYHQNETSKEDNRLFFLPASNSPAYLANEYQNLAQGGQPEYMYLKNPTFTLENIFFAKEIHNAFCHNLKINYFNYLSLFSVKQVALRADIYPLYSQIDPNKCWDLMKVKSSLDNVKELKQTAGDKNTALYEVNNENFLPLIYIPEKIIETPGDKKDLREITDFKNYQIKSAIYLSKENKDLTQLKPQSNEIFVRAEIENQFLEEESAVIFFKLQSIYSPYAQWQPGSFIYNWLLKRETIQENSLTDSPKDLFQVKIHNAAKRISETVKFFNRQLVGDDLKNEIQTQERYRQKMLECLELLDKIKKDDSQSFQSLSNDFYAAIKNHQETTRQLSLPVENKIEYESIFNELSSKLEESRLKHDFHSLKYHFEVEKEGQYQLFLKTDYLDGQLPIIKEIILDGQSLALEEKEWDFRDWQGLLSLNLNKGQHQLILSLEEGPNLLLGENWQQQENSSLKKVFFQGLNNYQPDALYQLSFDYTAYQSNAGFYLTQDYGYKDKDGKLYPLIVRSLIQTQLNEFKHQIIFIKALSFATPAQLSFFSQSMNGISNQASFKNIKMERVFEPMIVLKKNLDENQELIGNKKPIVSFTKINPTKYQVQIQGAMAPFNLILNQNFNHNWKIYFADSKKMIEEKNHWLANGYANGWLVNPGQDKDFNLTIEYYPQRFFYIGLGIAGLIILTLLTLVIYSLVRH